MRHETISSLDTMLQVRAPESLRDALDTAAGQKLISRSDYVRGALVEKLKADGFKLPSVKIRALDR